MGGGVIIFCLYGGVFLRASADVLLYAYLPLYFLNNLGETRLWIIGLLVGVPSLVRLGVAPLWGKYVDRVGRQGFFFTGGLLAYAIFFFLLPRFSSPMQVVRAAAFAAVFTSVFNPASRAWLLYGGPEQGLRRLASWHQWEAAGYLVSSVTIGWVVNNGYLDLAEIPLLLSMLLGIGAIAIGLFLPSIPTGSGAERRKRGQQTSSHLREIPGGADLLPYAALVYLLASSFTWEIVATTFGMYFIGMLGGSMRLYGLLMGTSTFVSVVAYGLLAGFCQKRGYYRVFQIAAWGYTAMYLLMVYPSVPTVSCGYLLPMNTVVRTAMNGLVANQVPEIYHGEAMGLMDSVEAGSLAWGDILGGLIAHGQGLAFMPKIALAGSVLLHILAPRTNKGR